MIQNNSTAVYYPKTVQEALLIQKSNAQSTFYAGTTSLAYGTSTRIIELGRTIISINNIPDLKTINKTERYIEIGTTVTLSDILALGNKNIPSIFYQALRQTGNYCIRNLATLGGNILTANHYQSLFAVLIALDAKVEVKTLTESIWKPLYQVAYDTAEHKKAVTTPQIITKVRIPLVSNEINIFEKFYITFESLYPETFVLTADVPDNIVTDIHIAYAGTTFFRFRELENMIAGRALPFSKKDTDHIIEHAQYFLDALKEDISKKRLISIIRKSLESLR